MTMQELFGSRSPFFNQKYGYIFPLYFEAITHYTHCCLISEPYRTEWVVYGHRWAMIANLKLISY